MQLYRRSYSFQHVITCRLLLHHRTCTTYFSNGCVAWYNVLITPWPRVHSSVKLQFQKGRQTNYTATDSCDTGISVLHHCQCLSWSKLFNSHLSHSRQWFNIHLMNILYARLNSELCEYIVILHTPVSYTHLTLPTNREV